MHNLLLTRKQLIDGTYKLDAPKEFTVNERGKIRNIKAVSMKDRVLQRALVDFVLFPLLSKKLIYDNGASIKEKGVDFTRERLNAHLQKYYRKYGSEGYILVGDFSKYYDSIPHDKLLAKLERDIPDKRVIELVKTIIQNPENRGLGIGSQVSQILGVYYTTELDNYIKIVKSCEYYARYNDDFYIINNDKEFLKDILREIECKSMNLGLKLNDKKTQIIKLSHGFSFMKIQYHFTDTGRIIRKYNKNNVVRQRRKIKSFFFDDKMPLDKIEKQHKSWIGTVKKFDSHNVIINMNNQYEQLLKEVQNGKRNKQRKEEQY